MIELIYQGIITLLSFFIGYYLVSKKAEKLIESKEKQYKAALETWLNSETGAKALYAIGAMIGTGAKQSIGINTRGGKFKFKDILAQVAGNWISNNLPGIGAMNQNNPTQELNSKSKDRILRSA